MEPDDVTKSAWIISAGVYSDYHVLAVVTDPEVARRFQEWRQEQTSWLGSIRIEYIPVWSGDSAELNMILSIPPGEIYRVLFFRSTGEINPRGKRYEGDVYRWGSGQDELTSVSDVGHCFRWDDEQDVCYVAAEGIDHAFKVAKDQYMMWKASGHEAMDD